MKDITKALTTYSDLLGQCAKNFADLFANAPRDGWSTAPASVVREIVEMTSSTAAAGNTARLILSAKSSQLGAELKALQDGWHEALEPILANLHESDNRAGFLSACANLAVQSELVANNLGIIIQTLSTSTPDTGSKARYPTTPDALKVLREAVRRKGEAKYAGKTNEQIALSLLLDEDRQTWWATMTKPKAKSTPAPTYLPAIHTRGNALVKDAAKRWGGYISKYINDPNRT